MSIDPETRDVVETVYIRRVEKVSGKLVNVEFDKIENVKDPIKAAMRNKGTGTPMSSGRGDDRSIEIDIDAGRAVRRLRLRHAVVPAVRSGCR